MDIVEDIDKTSLYESGMITAKIEPRFGDRLVTAPKKVADDTHTFEIHRRLPDGTYKKQSDVRVLSRDGVSDKAVAAALEVANLLYRAKAFSYIAETIHREALEDKTE